MWIRRQLGRYERDGCGLKAVLVQTTGDLIGRSGLLRQEVDERSELEVGYRRLPRARGFGFATEAARAFIDHALTTGMAERNVSIIRVANVASRRVTDRSGPEREFVPRCAGHPLRVSHAVAAPALRRSPDVRRRRPSGSPDGAARRRHAPRGCRAG